MRVLVLEDDVEAAQTIERGLTLEGHEVVWAGDVPGAIAEIDANPPEVAILDVMVPGGSGYDVLDHLRRLRDCPPIVIVTARDSVPDRVAGLDRGADDYLVKPFSLAELSARLRAINRRATPATDKLVHDPIELDLLDRQCRVRGRAVDLTRTEFDVLACLIREEGSVVSRRQLLRDVWRIGFDPGTNVVEVHVHRLRRKLEDAGAGAILQTVRGRGYALA